MGTTLLPQVLRVHSREVGRTGTDWVGGRGMDSGRMDGVVAFSVPREEFIVCRVIFFSREQG